MIPFDELVAALERYKQRRLATAAAAANSGPNKPVSGKAAQAQQRQQITELGDDLLTD